MLSFLQRPKIEAIRHRETKKQTYNEASDFVNSGQQNSPWSQEQNAVNPLCYKELHEESCDYEVLS